MNFKEKDELITRISSFVILVGLIVVQTLSYAKGLDMNFEMLIGFMLAMFLRG